jgi:hypothetical protein
MKLQGISPELTELFAQLKRIPSSSLGAIQVTQKALTLLKTAPYCYEERASLYTRLSFAVRPHALYHKKHTPLLSQFISWITKSAAPEAEIQRLYQECLEQAKQYSERDRQAKNELQKRMKPALSPHDELCLTFSSLFESLDYKPQSLDTPLSLTKEVGPWMLKHLEAFYKECKPNSMDRKVLEELITECCDHNVLGTALDTIKNPSFWSTFSTFGLDWTIHEIFNRIHTLTNGQQFALPGCSAQEEKYPDKRGQVVEYLVQKDENGLFTFTIVNVRIGANHLHEADVLFARLFGSYNEARTLNRMRDYCWKQIPKEAFSTQFITQLLYPIHTANATTSIVNITEQIERHLTSFNSCQESHEREHGGANKEDVAVKTISSWLHKSMKDPLWQKFKAFYTHQEVQKLDLLLSQNSIDETESSFLKSQAQLILARREHKARNS